MTSETEAHKGVGLADILLALAPDMWGLPLHQPGPQHGFGCQLLALY
jgi:hypothetical protein